MLKVTVYKAFNDGPSFFEAKGIITGTQKWHGITDYYVARLSIKLLANHLITFLRIMKDDDKWKQFEDSLEITFPNEFKIFHPLGGVSRIMRPVSYDDIKELWTYINYYTQREEVRYDDDK